MSGRHTAQWYGRAIVIVAIRVPGSLVVGFRRCDAVRERHHDPKGNCRGPEEGYDLWDNVKATVTVDTLWNEGECRVTVGHDWMNVQGYRAGGRKWARGR